MYSYRIEQAIRAATVLHHSQTRKGSMPYPYVTHLYSVAMLLMEFTDNEDVIIAALLHDTLEDTDYTMEELTEDFGGTVATIVDALTEKKTEGERTVSWVDRKKNYAKQLKNGPDEAIMIAAADKAHNFRTSIEDYYDDHNRFLTDFGKNLDERLEVYQTIANVINHRLKGPLLSEFNHVFTEYKNFIYDIKKAQEFTF
ncbi:MAG: HD domain-containing protein [Patescibacteria group bacterium]